MSVKHLVSPACDKSSGISILQIPPTMDSIESNKTGYCTIPAQREPPSQFNNVHPRQSPTLPRYLAVAVTAVVVTLLAVVGMSSVSNSSGARGLRAVMPFYRQYASSEMRQPSLIYGNPGYVHVSHPDFIDEVRGGYLTARRSRGGGFTNEPWCKYDLKKLKNGLFAYCSCKYSSKLTMFANNDDRDQLMNCFNKEVQAVCGETPAHGNAWIDAKFVEIATSCCKEVGAHFSVRGKTCY